MFLRETSPVKTAFPSLLRERSLEDFPPITTSFCIAHPDQSEDELKSKRSKLFVIIAVKRDAFIAVRFVASDIFCFVPLPNVFRFPEVLFAQFSLGGRNKPAVRGRTIVGTENNAKPI